MVAAGGQGSEKSTKLTLEMCVVSNLGLCNSFNFYHDFHFWSNYLHTKII